MPTVVYQINGGDHKTSMDDMLVFIKGITSYGIDTGALEASMRKRGNPIRRCRGCDKVYFYDYEVLNRSGGTDMTGEWLNRDEKDICMYLHHGETHDEYYARTGTPDRRKIRGYTAYLRYDRELTAKEMEGCPWQIRKARDWKQPVLGITHYGAEISRMSASKYACERECIQEFNRLHRLGAYVHLSHHFNLYWDFTSGKCKRYLDPKRSTEDRDPEGSAPAVRETHRKSGAAPEKPKEKPLVAGETIESGYPTLGGCRAVERQAVEQETGSTWAKICGSGRPQ